MGRNRTILQYVTALLLLVVFLAVHVGKALHTHNAVETAINISIETKHTINSPDCSTCDYQLTKDSDLDFYTITVSIEQEPILHIITYQSRHTASIGLCYADRGPPSIA